ncbi:hypothetical protein JHK86_004341 [Glycine max]|nr:hypothetical protein JHK86_004341 [Glycine max]
MMNEEHRTKNDVKFDYDRDSVAPRPCLVVKSIMLFTINMHGHLTRIMSCCPTLEQFFWRGVSEIRRQEAKICERSLTSSTSGPTGPPSTTFVRSEMLRSGFLIRL